jgi:virginiamycin B lyase
MRGLTTKLLAAVAALAALALVATPAFAAPSVTGVFKPASEIGQNSKIVAGPDGNMWFTEEGAKDVAKITPAGVITEYELPGTESPIGIAPGPEGRMWVVATGKATSFLPSDPKNTEQTFNSALINGEANIVFGPDGTFWVASNEKVAKFSPSDFNGTIKAVPLTGTLAAKDIAVAGSLIVIADGSSTNKRIVTFTTAGVQKDFATTGGSQGVAGAPNGQIGFSQQTTAPEQVGLISPPNPAQEFALNEDPFGVAYGSDDAFWVVRSAKDGVARVSSSGQMSLIGGLPAGSMPRQIGAGPGNTMWVTIPKAGEPAIARISGLEPPVSTTPSPTPPSSPVPPGPAPPALPQTLLGKLPKKTIETSGETANVSFAFSSTTAGARFECSLGRRVKPKGKKPRFVGQAFKGCKSPQAYTLKPGHYRFQVRAVSPAGRDASPAVYRFKVIHVAPR